MSASLMLNISEIKGDIGLFHTGSLQETCQSKVEWSHD